MLLVILGAGASYDSADHARPLGEEPSHLADALRHRPPLTDFLFKSSPIFDSVLSSYPQVKAVLPRLRQRKGYSLESVLTELYAETATHPERPSQLAAIRYYLRALLLECQKGWSQLGPNNYYSLLDHIRHRRSRYRDVTFVTFNYDTLLEEAIASVERPFASIDDYADSTHAYVTIKLHGSVNWARRCMGLLTIPPAVSDEVALTWVCTNLAKLEISPSVDLVNGPLIRTKGTPVVFLPALALPFRGLGPTKFECPPSHVHVLESRLPEVSKVLVIGWKAADGALLGLMKARTTRPAKWLLVGGSKGDAEVMLANIDQHRIAGDYVSWTGGFSDLVSRSGGNALDDFLAA